MGCGRECAVAYKDLLHLLHQIVLKPDDSSLCVKLLSFTKEVASVVSDIVKVASELKEGAGFIDYMSNPDVKAEQELLAAAASIEVAAKKLKELRVAPVSTCIDVSFNIIVVVSFLIQTTDTNLSFDAQILEATISIAATIKSLVQSAIATQQGLTEQRKVSLGSVLAGLVSVVSIYYYTYLCTCTCMCMHLFCL